MPAVFSSRVAVYALAFGDVEPEIGADVILPPTIQASVPKRRREFMAGRACAREALNALGLASISDLAIGVMGAPAWPPGFVGSISHSAGLAVAAAAHARDVRSLGVDVEAIVGSDRVASLRELIGKPSEYSLLAHELPDPAQAFTALFAAKEAVFKCLAPLVGRYFDFVDVEAVAAERDGLTVQLGAQLAAELPHVQRVVVRFAVFGERVMAGVLLAP